MRHWGNAERDPARNSDKSHFLVSEPRSSRQPCFHQTLFVQFSFIIMWRWMANFVFWIVLLKVWAKNNRAAWKEVKCMLWSHFKHQDQFCIPALRQILFSPLFRVTTLPDMPVLLWMLLWTQKGLCSIKNSLALLPTSFLWFLFHICLGELERRGSAAFSLLFVCYT